MKNQNIQMLAFDLFGVLITEGHLISNGLMCLLPTGTDKKRIKAAYEKFNLGEIKETDFWAGIGHTGNSPLRTDFLNSFSLDPEFELIHQLQRQYRLAILSNFPPDWANYISHKFHFEKYFETQIFSGHVQCKKPQAEIYKVLIQKSGTPAQKIAFIDDRLENLQSAHELGMTTIYYQREQETHTYLPDYRIKKLGELPIFLG